MLLLMNCIRIYDFESSSIALISLGKCYIVDKFFLSLVLILEADFYCLVYILHAIAEFP